LALLGAILSLGCGYKLVRRSDAPGDVRRVAIQGLTNETFEPWADSVVSDAIYREFLRRGTLRIVDDPAAADLVITGVVAELVSRRRSFSSIQFALESELRLSLEILVVRPDGTEVPVDNSMLRETELYFASSDVEAGRTYKQEATARLAAVLAGRIHDALTERITP